MVKHSAVTKEVKINAGDEILINGKWVKVKEVDCETIILETIKVVSLEELFPKWEIEERIDSSTSSIEFEIAVVLNNKRIMTVADECKVVLFSERSNIYPTRHNLQQMRSIAKSVKDFMNKEKISFESEECCER